MVHLPDLAGSLVSSGFIVLTNSPNKTTGNHPPRGLSLWDASSIVVGTIIGAAIFQLPPLVASQVDSLSWFIAAWLLGGFIAFCGALCFAELTTAYNEDGGDYVYLRQAFGKFLAFLFAWTAGWIIRPANIAAMAVTFATFAEQAMPGLAWIGKVPVAIVAVLLLGGLNLQGFQSGRWTQNLLTASKVIGLLLLVLIGFWPVNDHKIGPMPDDDPVEFSVPADSVETTRTSFKTPPESALTEPALQTNSATNTQSNPMASVEVIEDTTPSWGSRLSGLLMALVFVLYTFGGWNDVSFVAAEVKEPQRNLPRAVLLGLAVVTLIYLLVNSVLIANLGLEGLAGSNNAPADVVAVQMNAWGLGQWISTLLGLLVAVSCLGAVNAMLITSPRIYFAAGQDHRFLNWFARWDHQTETPRRALLAQTVATLLMLMLCAGLNSSILIRFGWTEGIFAGGNPFEELVTVSSPFFWLFLALVGMGLIVLRKTDPDRPRPIRTFGYPFTPLVFIVSSLFMCYSSFKYAVFDQQYLVSGSFVLLVFLIGILMGLMEFGIRKKVEQNPTQE